MANVIKMTDMISEYKKFTGLENVDKTNLDTWVRIMSTEDLCKFCIQLPPSDTFMDQHNYDYVMKEAIKRKLK